MFPRHAPATAILACTSRLQIPSCAASHGPQKYRSRISHPRIRDDRSLASPEMYFRDSCSFSKQLAVRSATMHFKRKEVFLHLFSTRWCQQLRWEETLPKLAGKQNNFSKHLSQTCGCHLPRTVRGRESVLVRFVRQVSMPPMYVVLKSCGYVQQRQSVTTSPCRCCACAEVRSG